MSFYKSNTLQPYVGILISYRVDKCVELCVMNNRWIDWKFKLFMGIFIDDKWEVSKAPSCFG